MDKQSKPDGRLPYRSLKLKASDPAAKSSATTTRPAARPRPGLKKLVLAKPPADPTTPGPGPAPLPSLGAHPVVATTGSRAGPDAGRVEIAADASAAPRMQPAKRAPSPTALERQGKRPRRDPEAGEIPQRRLGLYGPARAFQSLPPCLLAVQGREDPAGAKPVSKEVNRRGSNPRFKLPMAKAAAMALGGKDIAAPPVKGRVLPLPMDPYPIAKAAQPSLEGWTTADLHAARASFSRPVAPPLFNAGFVRSSTVNVSQSPGSPWDDDVTYSQFADMERKAKAMINVGAIDRPIPTESPTHFPTGDVSGTQFDKIVNVNVNETVRATDYSIRSNDGKAKAMINAGALHRPIPTESPTHFPTGDVSASQFDNIMNVAVDDTLRATDYPNPSNDISATKIDEMIRKANETLNAAAGALDRLAPTDSPTLSPTGAEPFRAAASPVLKPRAAIIATTPQLARCDTEEYMLDTPGSQFWNEVMKCEIPPAAPQPARTPSLSPNEYLFSPFEVPPCDGELYQGNVSDGEELYAGDDGEAEFMWDDRVDPIPANPDPAPPAAVTLAAHSADTSASLVRRVEDAAAEPQAVEELELPQISDEDGDDSALLV
ncbi:hypothetical protein BDK51DRAFT_49644, partial [Blyttiomyces helicus]